MYSQLIGCVSVPLRGRSLLREMCVTHSRVDCVGLLSDTWYFSCLPPEAQSGPRPHARPRVEPLRPWNVSEVSVSRVSAREWCHLLRCVTWLRHAPFGRFPIANGIVLLPHLNAGVNAGDNATLFAGSLQFILFNLLHCFLMQ